MSKPAFIGIAIVLVLLTALGTWAWSHQRPPDPTRWPVTRASLLRAAVLIPAGEHTVGSREPGCYPPRRTTLPAFRIWPVEFPQAWRDQLEGRAPTSTPRRAAAYVSHAEAEALCAALGRHTGLAIRLPTADEWQAAARAGTPGVPYPWGWNAPDGRAAFDLPHARDIASYPPNPAGLHDLAGNLAEWCHADPASPTAPALGGSWAERSPSLLRISHRMELPRTYRDADVGFRFVIE
ncbi:MAG TPA: SUMF1/EgtB/PvdO family nonheme iron enzyme [Kiritimatiellia bacterium]|nr:SUMF1/EgtB/PvdO family nonheme iron enzyme [Kiritimatiellia bacterium]HMP33518.1 SUMF1/EgtB/PvdO family nonheme iron enzyme [Kiritimatiellia bacterium]